MTQPERRNRELNAALHAYRAEISDLRRRLFRQQDQRAGGVLRRHLEALAPEVEVQAPAAADPPTERPPEPPPADAGAGQREQALTEALQSADARAAAYQAEAQARGELLNTVLGSTSWRITRPIRGLLRLAGRR